MPKQLTKREQLIVLLTRCVETQLQLWDQQSDVENLLDVTVDGLADKLDYICSGSNDAHDDDAQAAIKQLADELLNPQPKDYNPRTGPTAQWLGIPGEAPDIQLMDSITNNPDYCRRCHGMKNIQGVSGCHCEREPCPHGNLFYCIDCQTENDWATAKL